MTVWDRPPPSREIERAVAKLRDNETRIGNLERKTGVGSPTGDTVDAAIAALDPAGFWKLNEDSGLVAADSSGNGLDLTADTGPPVWAQPAGPPGEQTADFENGGSTTYARVARSWAALTGDFTAGLFISRNVANAQTHVMGQGNPDRAGGTGWMIWVDGLSTTSNKPAVMIAAHGSIFAANPLAADTWAMLAAVRDGTTFRLNVNGLDQASTYTGSFTASSSPLWIGNDGGLGGFGLTLPRFTGSYAFLFPTALTGAELLHIYETATIPAGANAGKALLANGFGGSYWDFPLEVTY